MRIRQLYTILVVIALCAAITKPVYADPIDTRSVTQVFPTIHSGSDLRIRNFSGSTVPIIEYGKHAQTGIYNANAPFYDPSFESDSLLSGISFPAISQDPQKIPQGDVDITICDCAEMTVPVGGFPKWPFLFIAGIPLFFIDRDDNTPVPTPTPPSLTQPSPTPTSTPTPPAQTVPEPGSILLFLSGLGALGWRVRRRRTKVGQPK